MWESSGFKESASDNVLVASDGSGGGRETPESVTRSIMHRGDLEQGPSGDLWSILLELIDERSGVTDVIQVKSHLEDVGPSGITQNKVGFHHMLANSLADVVAEERRNDYHLT